MVNPYQPPTFDPEGGAYHPPSPVSAAPPGPVEREVSAVSAFQFVFSDENWWKNALFGVLLQLIPLAGPLAVCGWLSEVHRRLVWHYDRPVPLFSFDDFGEYIKRGWVAFVAQLVVIMALLLPFGMAGALLAVLAHGQRSPLPLVFLPLVPLLLGLPFVAVSTTTLAELTESLGAALAPADNLRFVRRIWLKALISGLVLALLASGLTLLGLLACLVGMYVTAQVSKLAALHWRWQLYNESLRRGAAHALVKPPAALPSERRG